MTLVVHDINDVNKKISDAKYFFIDIKKEGIMLYDSGRFKLARARKLSEEERKAFAIEDFKSWFKDAKEFYDNFLTNLKKRRYRNAAFQLHQAAENSYNAILMTFTHYKPKTHDLITLGKQVAGLDPVFKTVFPRKTPEEKRLFKLLRDAYVKARYDKKYAITKDELEYLAKRVRKLKRLTKEVCQKKIESF